MNDTRERLRKTGDDDVDDDDDEEEEEDLDSDDDDDDDSSFVIPPPPSAVNSCLHRRGKFSQQSENEDVRQNHRKISKTVFKV